MSQAASSSIETADTIGVNLPSFLRSLRAERKSERTVETYREAVVQVDAYFRGQGMRDGGVGQLAARQPSKLNARSCRVREG